MKKSLMLVLIIVVFLFGCSAKTQKTSCCEQYPTPAFVFNESNIPEKYKIYELAVLQGQSELVVIKIAQIFEESTGVQLLNGYISLNAFNLIRDLHKNGYVEVDSQAKNDKVFFVEHRFGYFEESIGLVKIDANTVSTVGVLSDGRESLLSIKQIN